MVVSGIGEVAAGGVGVVAAVVGSVKVLVGCWLCFWGWGCVLGVFW